jgi:hypothetical protein
VNYFRAGKGLVKQGKTIIIRLCSLMVSKLCVRPNSQTMVASASYSQSPTFTVYKSHPSVQLLSNFDPQWKFEINLNVKK